MLCPSCGELLSSESRFCNFCGANLDSPEKSLESTFTKDALISAHCGAACQQHLLQDRRYQPD